VALATFLVAQISSLGCARNGAGDVGQSPNGCCYVKPI
jgi:hypothetical protein